MLSFNVFKILVFHFLLLSLVKLNNLKCEAAPTFLYNDCTSTSTFSPNSTFQRNLNSILSSLSSNSTRDNRFYNLTVGGDPEDIVYGLFLCRGDVAKDLCQDCVDTARKDIVQRCSREKAAIIFYEECMLRFSSQNFFGKLELIPALQLVNFQNTSQQEQFRDLLQRMTRNVTARISNDRSGRRFVTIESPFSSDEMIYALGQCTQDLSVSDCNKCLEAAFAFFLPGCCGVRKGVRAIFPSCNFRYELNPFYNVTGSPSWPRPAFKGKKNLSSGKIISIVAATIAITVLLILAIWFLISERRNKYNHR